MRLYGDYTFIYFRIVDYFNYCTSTPFIYGIDKDSLETFQQEIQEEMTDKIVNNTKITEFFEMMLIAIDNYRNYMLENAVKVSEHNKNKYLDISTDKNSRTLLAVLEQISNFSVNVCYVLFKLREKGKSIKDYVVPNENISQEQILELKDFVKLKEEVLSVLYDIYQL